MNKKESEVKKIVESDTFKKIFIEKIKKDNKELDENKEEKTKDEQ